MVSTFSEEKIVKLLKAGPSGLWACFSLLKKKFLFKGQCQEILHSSHWIPTVVWFLQVLYVLCNLHCRAYFSLYFKSTVHGLKKLWCCEQWFWLFLFLLIDDCKHKKYTLKGQCNKIAPLIKRLKWFCLKIRFHEDIRKISDSAQC